MKVNINEAVDQVRNLNRMFKAMNTLGDALEKIGSIEQFEREALQAKDKAQKEAAEAKAEAAKAVDELKAAKQKVKDADARAEELAKEGEANKSAIEAKAKEQAEKIVADADAELKRLQGEISKYHAQVKAFDGLISDKQTELDTINKKVEEAKSRIEKLLGA